ncbi:MAG: 5-formyltetrahydrofolate cyclo-ligase [Rhodospirillaceae bacterium]|nr:5-formyltetrahydrofolate cyclo-ligase [Rhodospirillaceae bacterium]
MRRVEIARRRKIHAARKVQAAAALAQRIAEGIAPQENKIAGYWPLGDEIDCRPALEALRARGAEVSLPVVARQGHVLLFRVWTPGDQLVSGPFGTVHPNPRAAMVTPNLLLLPLLAFDALGHRLGYGGGYYDRTVAALRKDRNIQAVGIAYDDQEVETVPTDDNDQPLDAIITDRRTMWFKQAHQL